MMKSKNGKATVNSDNSKGQAKRRGRVENLRPWPKGVSGNPKGAPRRGESWADIIKRVGELTPGEASEMSLELSKKLLSIGEGVTLKQAVVLRVYGALLFDPNAGLLNAFMERAEGKVSQPIEVNDLRNKIDDELVSEFQSLVDAARASAGRSDTT